MKRGVIWRKDAAYTVQIGPQSVTPVARTIGIRWLRGGFIWQFPVAVEVTSEGDDKPKRLPIPFVTRTAILSFYALALIVLLVAWQQRRRAQQVRKELVNQKG